MNWWGKIVGGTVGLFLGGGLGAALGAALGHQLDRIGLPPAPKRDSDRSKMAFFTATFAVMGHLCKVDGRVSEDEIRVAEGVMAQMHLSADQRATGIRLFNQGKRASFALNQALVELYREIGHSRHLCFMFLEIQIGAALADAAIHPAERRVLNHVRQCLRVNTSDYARIEAVVRAKRPHGGQRPKRNEAAPLSLSDAYAMLNVSADASDGDITKAYRRLINQHHPDKLVAKGLPEEMMELATQKTHELRAAYNQIRRARKIS